MNNYFYKINKWDVDEIKKRSKFLIEKYVKEMWNFSHLYEELGWNHNEWDIDINTILETDFAKSNEGLKKQNSSNKYKGYDCINKQIHQFKKIKRVIDLELLYKLLFEYLINGIAGETLEKKFFGTECNFKGWVCKSIVDALDIKNKKKKISREKFNDFIKIKDKEIKKLFDFIKNII